MKSRILATLRRGVQRSPADPEHQAPELLQAIEAARDFVHGHQAPDLSGRVMQQIRPLEAPAFIPQPRWLALCHALWRPRPVALQLRPAYGIAAAVALVAWMAVGAPVPGAGRPTPPAEAVFVQFRLLAEDASSVRLAGTFTGWQPDTSLHQVSPGVWTATVLVPSGVHEYAYVVNGDRWVADPFTPVIPDGFGGQANRLALLPQSEASGL